LSDPCFRADVPREFILREFVYYRVLVPLYVLCTVDTSDSTPVESLRELILCLEGAGVGNTRIRR